MAKNKKIVKYRKPIHINIGVIIFSIILLYVIFNIFVYLTKDHISVYEVQQGTIAENNVYSGLVLRSEVPYYSDYTGSLNYYVKDASKVAANQMVYSVDEEGSIASAINDANQDGSKMDSDSLSEVEDSIDNFKNSYSREEFYNTYTFRDDVNSMLNEALSQNALDTLSQDVSTAINNNTFHPVNAAESGVITYYVDGFEGVTVDSFTKEMFQQSNYQKTNLKANVSVSAGAPVYKMINSEIWNIIVPIDETMATRLADHTVVEIKFLKDNKTMYAYYEIREQDGQNYLILTLKSAMIRYAKEVYIEIELLLSEESGLKIPNYASNLVCLVKKDSGTEFVLPTIYYSDDTYYYIDSEDVQKGDILQKPDSNEQYTIGTDVASLNGVYNVNKGYAVFKQIDVIYQNEEYSILKTGTTYGLSLYDHIALDGSKVTENQLIN